MTKKAIRAKTKAEQVKVENHEEWGTETAKAQEIKLKEIPKRRQTKKAIKSMKENFQGRNCKAKWKLQ